MPELLYDVGGNIYALFILLEGREREYRVGRDPENDFCLSQADPSVSGRHGLVRSTEEGFVFADCDSRNGSFLQRASARDEEAWEPIKGRDVRLLPGDVIRLGEKTFLHFGDYLSNGSFFLAERLLEMFAAAEEGGGESREILSTFLYRLLGILLNILQAREGFIEVSPAIAGTSEPLRVSGYRDREIPHVRRGHRAILRTLSPEELRNLDWRVGEVVPISQTWVRAVRRGDTVQHLFNEKTGVEFTRVQPEELALKMRNRALCVPLRAVGERIGVVYMAREKDTGVPFAREEAERAEDLGFLAGSVLDRLLSGRGKDPLDDLIGNPHVRTLIAQWETNPSLEEVPVLISGERGTGKEIVARAIHHHSRRRSGPFVPVNLALHSGDRLAPELFGTAAGKFTGVIDSPGLFEVASGGTLFLDEIGAMDPDSQGKLLRAVERKEIMRVGGSEVRSTDARIIVATNRDLRAAADERKFLPDLYDRLSFLEIHLHAVREFAEEDRNELFRKLLWRMSHRLSIWGLEAIADDAMVLLMSYPWLGNAREVEKELGNAVIRWSQESAEARGREIALRHLSSQIKLYSPGVARAVPGFRSAGNGVPADGRRPPPPGLERSLEPSVDLELKRAVDAVVRHHFEQALLQAGGQAKEAAEMLGLNLKTFYRRARELGLGGEIGRKRKPPE